MSSRRARRRAAALLCRGLVGAVLAGALLCGCATSARQCTGPLQPINGPASAAAAPDERDGE